MFESLGCESFQSVSSQVERDEVSERKFSDGSEAVLGQI